MEQELETEELETYNSNEVQNSLYLLTHERVESIKYIIRQYHCNVIYRFYVWIHKNEIPSLWFEQKLLIDINYLEAEIDIVISKSR